jgi:hypothetical protein
MQNRNWVRTGSGVLAAGLALAMLGLAWAQTQTSPGPGGMMGRPVPIMGGHRFGPGAQAQTVSLQSLDAAREAFQHYLEATGNPDLALDEVLQFQWNSYGVITERSSDHGVRAAG